MTTFVSMARKLIFFIDAMKQSKIKKSIKKHFRKLQEAYHDILVTWSMDAIHRFRVRIKHIRAFARMIETDSKKHPSISRQLKKVYHRSGAVRNWQLFLQTFSRNRSLKRYAARSLDAAISGMKEFMTSNLVDKAKKKMLRKVPRHFKNKGMRVFRHDKWQAIDHVTHQKELGDDQLHSIRKNLKDLQYDNLMASADTKKKYYNKLMKKLGSLQDCRIELQLLEEINRQQASIKIQKLVNRRVEKKNRLASEITNELKGQNN